MTVTYTAVPEAIDPDAAHRFDRVDVVADALVLRCSCGWVSTSSSSGEAVGSEWDHHLARVSRLE